MGDLNAESGGEWADENFIYSYFEDGNLFVDEDDATFWASASSSFPEGMVVTVRSTVAGYGYEELPSVPSVRQGYKTAVAPLEGGNYFVLGYDRDRNENEWMDSGVRFVEGRDVEVTVELRYTNEIYVATYGFDGVFTRPIEVLGMDVRRIEFSGCGTVSGLSGHTEFAPAAIAVRLPVVEGVASRLADGRSTAYAGEVVEVVFDVATRMPSRGRARYRVDENGGLIFADDGEEPYGVIIEAMIDSTPYASFAEAARHLGYGETVMLMTDVILDEDVMLVRGWLDLNGFSVYSASDDVTLTLDGANLWNSGTYESIRGTFIEPCGIIARLVVTRPIDVSDVGISFWDLVLGAPDASVRLYGGCHCSSYDGRYLVKEEESYDSWKFTYSLVENPDWVEPSKEPVSQVNSAATLLGCAPEAVEEESSKFRIIGIERKDGQWVVKVTGGKTHGDRYGNGYVSIKRVEFPGGSSSEGSSAFFRAELVPEPPSAE